MKKLSRPTLSVCVVGDSFLAEPLCLSGHRVRDAGDVGPHDSADLLLVGASRASHAVPPSAPSIVILSGPEASLEKLAECGAGGALCAIVREITEGTCSLTALDPLAADVCDVLLVECGFRVVRVEPEDYPRLATCLEGIALARALEGNLVGQLPGLESLAGTNPDPARAQTQELLEKLAAFGEKFTRKE